jgi:hypothetical protein
VGILGVGNIFVRSAPVRCSIARAYAIWWTPPRTSRKPVSARAAGCLTISYTFSLLLRAPVFQEEVVGQVFDQIARREHVVTVPRAPLRVLSEGALPASEEVVGVAETLYGRERLGRRLTVFPSARAR